MRLRLMGIVEEGRGLGVSPGNRLSVIFLRIWGEGGHVGQPTPNHPSPRLRRSPAPQARSPRDRAGGSRAYWSIIITHTPLPGDETARGVCGLLSLRERGGGCGVFSSLGGFLFSSSFSWLFVGPGV